jgi:DNA repair protein RadC
MYKIKEMPVSERPRERLVQYGETVIQTHELIAILFRTGHQDESALDLAKELLYRYGSLKELAHAPLQEYRMIRGIGMSKAVELKAAFELGRRSVRETFHEQIALRSPEAIFLFLKDKFELKTQEHLVALYLNTKGELLRQEVLFIGSLNTSVVHPRDIFRHAVLNSAASIVLCHNHPSGDPTPSRHDLDVTRVIAENGRMMDIPLLDHIILGRDRYYSCKEKGVL